MINIVKDIKENCPECECDTEKTVRYLYEHGDISPTSEYYREIWYFYEEALTLFKGEVKKKMKARNLTMEHFKISYGTFKNVKARVKHG
jgi:hypothetical protein